MDLMVWRISPSDFRSAAAHSEEMCFFLSSRAAILAALLRLLDAPWRRRWESCGLVVSAAATRSAARWMCLAIDGAMVAQTGGSRAPLSKTQVRAAMPVRGVKTHPLVGSQVSVVQGSVSWQVMAWVTQVRVAASQVPEV